MSALLTVLPPLVQVLTIAGGIHYVNHYREQFVTGTPKAWQANLSAFRIAWQPCVLSSATTVVGIGSLAESGLAVVREFGVFSAIGVFASCAVLLVVLPGVIALTGFTLQGRSKSHSENRVWYFLFEVINNHALAISFVSVVAMIGLGLGIPKIETSVRIETLFGPNSKLIEDYTWLEKNIGAMVPLEMLVEIPADSNLSFSEKQSLLQRLVKTLREEPQIQSITSSSEITELVYGQMQMQYELAASQGLPVNISEVDIDDSSRALLKKLNHLSTNSSGDEVWRVTAYTMSIGGASYGKMIRSLETKTHDCIAEEPSGKRSGIKIEFSILMPLVHEIQHQLLDDLFMSFITAFGLIAIVIPTRANQWWFAPRSSSRNTSNLRQIDLSNFACLCLWFGDLRPQRLPSYSTLLLYDGDSAHSRPDRRPQSSSRFAPFSSGCLL